MNVRDLLLTACVACLAVLAAVGCSPSSATGCPIGQTECAPGFCTNVLADSANCGTCGMPCMANNACVSGQCVPIDASQTGCPANTLQCSNGCVDYLNDAVNCGTCAHVCSPGQSCSSGQCGCAGGLESCATGCIDTSADSANCGACGNSCGTGESCVASACACGAGLDDCGQGCVSLASDVNNCGACSNACPGVLVCNNSACADTCDAGKTNCNRSCVDVLTDVANCGACGNPCAAGQSCVGGACSCATPGQLSCNGSCVDVLTNPQNCGTCGNPCGAGQTCSGGMCVCGAGQEPCNGGCVAAGTCVMGAAGNGAGGGSGAAGGGSGGSGTIIPNPEGRSCPTTAGLVSDFEEDSFAVLAIEGRGGVWEGYGDPAGTQTIAIESEGTEACNQGVLHMSGSGYNNDGGYVGLAGVIYTTETNAEGDPIPLSYDASQYTGISFRAKAGPNNRNPVRISFPTPWTEGGDYGDCVDGDDNSPCWNHMGHFLIDDHELTTSWKTFTFCFDRDLHPMFLPSGTSDQQRRDTSANLLKLQFQFNQGFNPDTAEQHLIVDPFDFYLDDVRFTTAPCAEDVFQSTDGASDPFGTNAAIGSCSLPSDAALYNTEITQAYRRWKANFVRSDGGVVDPQEGNRVVSEAIGYGMLITAAMGDKAAFDSIWGWASSRIGSNPTSLLGWENGGGGSATDGDTDMAYALYMAGKQWGGSYASAGGALAGLARSQDVNGNGVLGAGNQYLDRLNPSYFSPGFYRAFSNWESVTSATNSAVASCAGAFGDLTPDWCSIGGSPEGAGSANQQAGEVCEGGGACLAFDGARVPWRLGFDACLGGNSTVLSNMMSSLKSKDTDLANGARVDLLAAGWVASGPTAGAVDNAMAFIGPVGVGAMGVGDTTMFERAWHTTLDIMERPEYYNTYYQATVAMMALLTMSGNWPVP